MTQAFWQSAFKAALFCLHPLHVESMVWVAERKDVLSTVFGMITIIMYYKYVKQRQAIKYILMVSFFSLGLMAKPMLVTLPFVLLLLDYWPFQRLHYNTSQQHSVSSKRFIRLVWEKVPLFVLVSISSVLTFVAQHRDRAVGAAFLIAGACFLAIRKLRSYPYIAVGLFWYLGTLVPVIGLIQDSGG